MHWTVTFGYSNQGPHFALLGNYTRCTSARTYFPVRTKCISSSIEKALLHQLKSAEPALSCAGHKKPEGGDQRAHETAWVGPAPDLSPSAVPPRPAPHSTNTEPRAPPPWQDYGSLTVHSSRTPPSFVLRLGIVLWAASQCGGIVKTQRRPLTPSDTVLGVRPPAPRAPTRDRLPLVP